MTLGVAHAMRIGGDRVHVGGVEERDAGLDGGIHDGEGRVAIALAGKRHRAEREARHLKPGAAEASVLHAGDLTEWHSSRRLVVD